MAKRFQRYVALVGLVVWPVAVLSAQGSQRGTPAPGVAISGRVLAPDGGPAPNTFVTALRRSPAPVQSFRPVSVRLRAMTNEQGEYRLEGLSAGEYFLIALPHNAYADTNGTPTRTGFGNTFYPGVASFTDAKVVTVGPGNPRIADIKLLSAPIRTITGAVIGSNGQPVAGGTLALAHGDGLFGLDGRAVFIRPDGTFRAPGLQPGTYFLQFHESQWPPPRGVIPRVSQAKVTITDVDVTGVRVVPLTMVRASGRLILDAADRAALDVGRVSIGATPDPFDGNPGPQRPGSPNKDLTFEFQTWPMPGRIRVIIEEPGWVVKAIKHNGVDITSKSIDFVQGQQITGLEVVVAKGSVGG